VNKRWALKRKAVNKKNIHSAVLALLAAALVFLAASCGTTPEPSVDNQYVEGYRKGPWGVALNQEATRLYVANNLEHSVDIIDTSSMTVLTTIPVLCSPKHVVFNGDYTKLFVSHDKQDNTKLCAITKDPNVLTEERRSGAWATVIDIATSKVKKEIALDSGGRELSKIFDATYDPVRNLIYMKDAVIDPVTETLVNYMSISGATLFKNRLDAGRNILYSLDSANHMIYVRKPTDPALGKFDNVTYDAQTRGYCAGSSNLRNGCACTSGRSCASGKCDTTTMQEFAYCVRDCSLTTAKKSGCSCAGDSECASGICSSGMCATKTQLNISIASGEGNMIRGYCDMSSKACVEESVKNLSGCTNPWDMELMSDNTMFVTCNGTNDTKTELQPLYRFIVDDDGLASNNSSVATDESAKACMRPTEIGKDPSERHLIVLCTGAPNLLNIHLHDGFWKESIGLTGYPADVVVTDNYAYITLATKDTIYRYPIPD